MFEVQETLLGFEGKFMLLPGTVGSCVADRPVRPRVTRCVVRNWTWMTCTWEPEHQSDTGLSTTQQLLWRIT